MGKKREASAHFSFNFTAMCLPCGTPEALNFMTLGVKEPKGGRKRSRKSHRHRRDGASPEQQERRRSRSAQSPRRRGRDRSRRGVKLESRDRSVSTDPSERWFHQRRSGRPPVKDEDVLGEDDSASRVRDKSQTAPSAEREAASSPADSLDASQHAPTAEGEDVTEKVWGQIPTRADSDVRKELLEDVFDALDQDRDKHLNCHEVYRLAESQRFPGLETSDEWHQEWKRLVESMELDRHLVKQGWNVQYDFAMTYQDSCRFVNRKKGGQYMTNQELEEILNRKDQDIVRATPGRPAGNGASGSAGTTVRVPKPPPPPPRSGHQDRERPPAFVKEEHREQDDDEQRGDSSGELLGRI